MTSQPRSACFICGRFTLYNGRVLPIPQPTDSSSPDSVLMVYDTSVKSTSGSFMNAKLFIAGLERFPNGAAIYALAKGGPLPPFGYLLYVSHLTPSVAVDRPIPSEPVQHYNRLGATGNVVSCATETQYGDLTFELETVTNINGNSSAWVLRCIVNRSRPVTIPTINDRINIFGLIENFMSSTSGRRKLDVNVLNITFLGDGAG